VITGGMQTVSITRLIQELFQEKLEFLTEGPTQTVVSVPAVKELDLTDYSPEHVAIARFRLKAIEPLLQEANPTRMMVKDRLALRWPLRRLSTITRLLLCYTA
jgi:hypothetical protein